MIKESNVRRGHARMFRILKYLDRLCRENRLTYWICGGTLIGAIFHKGWKPNGSDIDITLPERDYARLYDLVLKNPLEGTSVELVRPILFRIVDSKGKYSKGSRRGVGLIVDVSASKVKKGLINIRYRCQIDEGNEKIFRKNILFPLREYEFEEGSFFGPNKPVSFLRCFKEGTQKLNDYGSNIEYFRKLREDYDANSEIEVNFISER